MRTEVNGSLSANPPKSPLIYILHTTRQHNTAAVTPDPRTKHEPHFGEEGRVPGTTGCWDAVVSRLVFEVRHTLASTPRVVRLIPHVFLLSISRAPGPHRPRPPTRLLRLLFPFLLPVRGGPRPVEGVLNGQSAPPTSTGPGPTTGPHAYDTGPVSPQPPSLSSTVLSPTGVDASFVPHLPLRDG